MSFPRLPNETKGAYARRATPGLYRELNSVQDAVEKLGNHVGRTFTRSAYKAMKDRLFGLDLAMRHFGAELDRLEDIRQSEE